MQCILGLRSGMVHGAQQLFTANSNVKTVYFVKNSCSHARQRSSSHSSGAAKRPRQRRMACPVHNARPQNVLRNKSHRSVLQRENVLAKAICVARVDKRIDFPIRRHVTTPSSHGATVVAGEFLIVANVFVTSNENHTVTADAI